MNRRIFILLPALLLTGCDSNQQTCNKCHKEGYEIGHKKGYANGYKEGYNVGYKKGDADGYLRGTKKFISDSWRPTLGFGTILFLGGLLTIVIGFYLLKWFRNRMAKAYAEDCIRSGVGSGLLCQEQVNVMTKIDDLEEIRQKVTTHLKERIAGSNRLADLEIQNIFDLGYSKILTKLTVEKSNIDIIRNEAKSLVEQCTKLREKNYKDIIYDIAEDEGLDSEDKGILIDETRKFYNIKN